MDLLNLKPDDQSHHQVFINNRQLQITFRYFSPSKYHATQALDINKVTPDSMQSSSERSPQSSVIANEDKETGRQKIQHNPQRNSDKFYEDNLGEIHYSTLNYYEQFQCKLLHKGNGIQKNNKVIKIKLTRNANVENIHTNTQQRDHSKINYVKKMNVYLNRPQIKIQKEKKQEKIQKQKYKSFNRRPIFNRSSQRIENREILSDQKNPAKNKVSPKKKIQIKLYEDKKIIQNQAYITPRKFNTSNRKGIIVYSSSSTKRETDGDVEAQIKTHNKTLSSLNHNISTNGHLNDESLEKQEKKLKSHIRLKSIKLSDGKCKTAVRATNEHLQNLGSSQIKRRVQRTKKRVFSKSKLSRKSNPVLRKIMF